MLNSAHAPVLFSDRRWVDMIDPDDLTPDILAECISSHLKHPNGNKPNALPNLNGAAVAAKHTLAVLAPKKGTSSSSNCLISQPVVLS